MSYYSSPYDRPGSYMQQSGVAVPRPTYDTQTYPTAQSEATASTYGNHHGIIPGLGMEYPVAGTAQYEQMGAESTYGAQGNTYAAPSAHVGDAAQAFPQNAMAIEDDDRDEGEIDEGELDDVYEPSWPQGPSTGQSALIAGSPGPQGMRGNAATGSDGNSPDAERGSYSPFLSPQEIEPGNSVGNLEESIGSYEPSNPQPPPHTEHHEQQRPRPSAKSLADARKEAQDAVLRLWPLKVRFHNYLEAGIDENVLRELFLNLGFDPTDASPKGPPSATKTPQAPTQDVSSSMPFTQSTMDAKKDAAETRKDRIARRLAAKGSERPALSPEPSKSTPAPKPQAPPASKAKLDKSKLLQQKMEALKKAREARQPTISQNSEGMTGVKTPQQIPQPSQIMGLVTDENVPSSQEDPRGQTASNIPGLSFPSSPAPAAAGLSKRPVASDLNDVSEAPFKRPFGQPRQPEKFLIDVSDDEDDAAMDLDSPEIRPASVNKPNSPFKIPSFPETQSGFMGRQMSSPMATPRAPTSGDDDLQAKVKDIAELKRQIAQREAEMKAKASRPASPAVGGSSAPLRAISVTSSSAALGSEAKAPTLSDAPLKPRPFADFAGEAQRPPKASEVRRQSEVSRFSRSGSRAASERLITEAQAKRREKELKLQFMKSQILKMEKEIQDSLDAEERMKAEAPEESEDEVEEPIPETVESQPVSNSSEDYTSSLPPAQDVALPLAKNPLHDDTGSGPVEEVEIESDAAAAISSSEGAADAVEPSGAESQGVRLSDTANGGPRHYEGEPGTESPPIDTPDAGVDEAMPDVEEVPEQPTVAETFTPSDSSPEEDSEADEDEQDEGEVEADEKEPATAAFPEDAAVPEIEARVASSDSESEGDSPDASETSPIRQPISNSQAESKPASPREGHSNVAATDEGPTGTGFVPYESFLKMFRAYRFHPDFANSVSGGLRSLTYSNGIDPNLPLCPDELAGAQCSRGADCIYQHFDSLQAPDDQILMQLGGYGNYEGEHKQEFNNGLRQILADARDKKIKDFDTLAKSIIDYRAGFRKDPYKILPLGDIKL